MKGSMSFEPVGTTTDESAIWWKFERRWRRAPASSQWVYRNCW